MSNDTPDEQERLNQWLDEHHINRRDFLKWAGAVGVSTGALLGGVLMNPAPAVAAGWQPKTAPLMTQWAAQVSPTNAWPLYPRPQMTRTNWQNLNGVWQFDWSSGNDQPPTGRNLPQSILVPYPIESALSGIMAYQPYMWYRTLFTVPTGWAGQHVVLHFQAVDWQTTVYLNGQQLGQHSGGYDSFSFDITSGLHSGTNELIVHVFDPTENGTQPCGKQRNNGSGPGSVFYTACSGIWQTVWLEPVPAASITRLDITPDIDNQRLRLTVQGAGINGQTITAVASTNGTTVGTASGTVGSEIDIAIPNPHLWSPNDPFLYDLTISLKSGGTVVDQVTSYFGMRKISVATVGNCLRPVLNNRFVFQLGPLDQGYWPDGNYTAPTDDAMQFDIQQTKNLGYNTIRKHMKVEPLRWYYWADKLGVVVWQDMPAMWPPNGPSANDVAQFQTELQAMITQHQSITCITQWATFNEGWGEPDQGTVNQVVANVRSWDPSRLIDDATGGVDAGSGDLIDIHLYEGPWTNPPSSSRASVCGEFGGIEMLVGGHEWYPNQTIGNNWPTNGTDLANQYATLLGYAQDDIPITGRGMSAAIYTQITDVEGEVNGLFTYDRAVLKPTLSTVQAANQRVIGAGDALNSPPQPVVWLRGDAGIQTNGSGVTGWLDQSGNGHNATVGSGQPSLSTNALNGHAVVHFNGANSQLVLPRVVQDDFTLVTVFRSTQGVGTGPAWYSSAGLIDAEVPGIVNDFGLALNANGQINAGTGNTDTYVDSGGGFNDGRPHVVTFKRIRSSGALTLYVDGTQVATMNAGTQSLTSPSRMTLGSTQTNSNYLLGDLAEVRIYNAPLADSDRHALEAQLISAYGISTAIPHVGLVAWLKGDVGVQTSGSAVTGWLDQSGYPNNATVGTGQPSFVTNAINGHPIVHFNGVNSQLVLPRLVQDDFTLITVFRSTQGVGTGPAWYTSAGLIDAEVPGIVNDFGLALNANGQVTAGTGNPDTFADSGSGLNNGNPHVAIFKRVAGGGALTLYVDGNQVATATGGAQSLVAPGRMTLGSTQTNSNYFAGDLAEVLIYYVALSDSDRQSVQQYLHAKYGTP